MRYTRLGAAGIALVLLLLVSLILSAFFCTFPWSMTARSADAQERRDTSEGRQPRDRLLDPMTLVYAADDSTEARKQIDAGNARFIEAWKWGDADLFASCFAEDGALLHPGRPAIVGREKIRSHMKDVFSRVRMTEGTITTIDVFLIGDTAYETGKWRFAIGPVGKRAKSDSGYFVEVWKRQGTRWLMWRDIGVPHG